MQWCLYVSLQPHFPLFVGWIHTVSLSLSVSQIHWAHYHIRASAFTASSDGSSSCSPWIPVLHPAPMLFEISAKMLLHQEPLPSHPVFSYHPLVLFIALTIVYNYSLNYVMIWLMFLFCITLSSLWGPGSCFLFFLPLYTIIYDKTGTQYVQKYLNG